jgi:hypothetical protein
MRRRIVLLVAALGVVLALPANSSAQAPPARDSVVLTNGPGLAGSSGLRIVELNATSGPSGENPSGRVHFEIDVGGFVAVLAGPVTCLRVSGRTATLNFDPAPPAGGPATTVEVVDGQPDTFTSSGAVVAPTDCLPLDPSFFRFPLTQGEITVVDATPLPTTKDQCKNGGWQSYGVFKNQGDCVSFVATGGKNPPANSP